MRSPLTAIFLAIFFFGVHTQLSLTSGGQLIIPYVVTALAATCIVIVNLDSLSWPVIKKGVTLGGLLLGMIWISAIGAGGLGQRFITSADLLYSLGLAYAGFIGISALGLPNARRLFLISSLALVIGSYLEVYGILRPVSETFREVTAPFHSQYGGEYEGEFADARDDVLYGHIRPKLFAVEPSVLGISAGTAILCWFLSCSDLSWKRLAAALFFWGNAFNAIRSPTILICSTAGIMIFLSELNSRRAIPFRRLIVLGLCTLIGIIAGPLLVNMVSSYGQSGSFFQRQILPLPMTLVVLRSRPFFGTGLGGYGVGTQYAIDTLTESNRFAVYGAEILREYMMAGLDPRIAIANAFWEFWIELGLLGGILVLYSLSRIFEALKVPNRFFVFIIGGLLATNIGGVSAPTPWVFLFAIASLYRLHIFARDESLQAISTAPVVASAHN